MTQCSPTGQNSVRPRTVWLRLADMKLSLAAALVCGLTIAGLWLVTLQRIAFERDQVVEATMRSNANLAIAYEEQVFRTLKAAEQVAAFVREEYLRLGPDVPLKAWVERGVIREKQFTIVSVVNELGDIVASSSGSPNAGRTNYADRPFFQVQRDARQDRLFVNPPVLGRLSGQWQIPMSLRVTRSDGSFAGVVVLSVDPASLTGAYHHNDLGDQALLELAGLDGVVRAREANGNIGTNARALPWFQRQQQAAQGSFVDDGATVDGSARIISYRTMPEHPLMVTVGTSLATAMAPAQQRQAGPWRHGAIHPAGPSTRAHAHRW